MINLLSWLAVVLFTFSSIFQAFKSIRQGHSLGISRIGVLARLISSSLLLYVAYVKNLDVLKWAFSLDILFKLIVIYFMIRPKYKKFLDKINNNSST